jgi:hypothetical protein
MTGQPGSREQTFEKRAFAVNGGTNEKERFAVVQNVERNSVEAMRKPVRCVRVQGGLREATTGRPVLLRVQASEEVLYNVEPVRPEAEKDGRRTRSCRGLTLVKGAATPATVEDVRPLELATAAAEPQARPRPELAFYRKYTEAMLRRYVKMSTEAGRTPSLLGREMFRARVTSYRMHSFEDVVAFCVDVERCLEKLQPGEKALIKRITMQEYSQAEAAAILGLSLRGVIQRYGAALDRLTAILLAAGLMEPLRKLAQAYEVGSAAS